MSEEVSKKPDVHLQVASRPDAIKAMVAEQAARIMADLVDQNLDDLLMGGEDKFITDLTINLPGGVRLRIEAAIWAGDDT